MKLTKCTGCSNGSPRTKDRIVTLSEFHDAVARCKVTCECGRSFESAPTCEHANCGEPLFVKRNGKHARYCEAHEGEHL